jgi:hypothetical protein
MDLTDQPEETRAGEELDPAKITDFLSETIPGGMGSITLQQFPRGYSNLTYLVKAGEEEFVLRRPPFGTKAKRPMTWGGNSGSSVPCTLSFPIVRNPSPTRRTLRFWAAPFT